MNPEDTTDDDIAELRMQALLTKRLNEAEVHSSQAQMDSQQRRDPSIQPPLVNARTISGRNNIAVPIAGQLPIANLGYNLKYVNSNINPSLQNKGHYSGMKRNVNQNDSFNQRKGYHQQPAQTNSNNLVLALPQDKYSNKTNVSSTNNEKLPDKNLSARWQRMQNSGSDSSDSGSSDSDSSSSDSDSSSNSSSDSDSSSESTSTDEGEKSSKLKKKDLNLSKPIASNVSKVEQQIREDEDNKNLSVMKDSKRSYSPWKSNKFSPNSSTITDLKTSHNESVTKFHDVGIPRKPKKSAQNEKPIEMMSHSPTLAKKITEKNVESIGTNMNSSPLRNNKPDFEKSVTPQKAPVARSPRSLSPGYRMWLLKKGYIRSVSRESISPLRKNSRSPPCRKSKSPFRRMSRSPFRRGSSAFRRGSKSPFRRASRSPIFHRRSRSRLNSRTPTKMSPLSPPRKKFIESSKMDSRSPRRRVSRSPFFRRGSKSPFSKRGSITPPYRKKSRSSPFRSSRTPRKSKSPIYRRSSRSSIRRSSRSPYIRRGSRSPLSKNISRSLVRRSKSPKRIGSRSPRSGRDSSSQALRNSRSPVRHLSKCDKIARSPYNMKNPKSPMKLPSRSPNGRRSRSESPGYKAWLRERIRRSISRKRKLSAERAKESVNGLRSPSIHRSEQLTDSKLTSPYKSQSQYKVKPLFFDETVTVSSLPGDTIPHDQPSLIHPVSMPHDKRGPMPHDKRGPMPHDKRGPMPHDKRGPKPHDKHGPMPHDERGPIPHEQRGPIPHEQREPIPHEQRGPIPHDQRGPIPLDQCGPIPHDRRDLMPHDRRDLIPNDQHGPMLRDQRSLMPHNRPGPALHDHRDPMPHNHRDPMPHNHRDPMPHNQRGPMPHDQRGPMPHDQRGPMPHDQRGPMPHDQRGPMPHDQRGPMPHDQRGPMQHDQRGPMPRDQRGPMPHDQRGPMPHDLRGTRPNDQRGPIPHDQRGPIPHDRHGPISHDQHGPISHDRRGPISHDRRGPLPHDRRGPMPQDHRRTMSHDQRGPMLHDQRGLMPLDQRGPMPLDQRGSMPHDQRGPMAHDQRGPMAHNQRGPIPHGQRGPIPHDQRALMTHGRRDPIPHDRRDPIPHDRRDPMPHDRRDQMPHDQRGPMLQDRRGRPMPGDRRMHEVQPGLMSQNDRNPIHPDHSATKPRIQADLIPQDGGELRSRDRGEPRSRDGGEPRSRDRGKPPSRDRGEPPSRDRGQPRSSDRNEPRSRDRGEQLSRDVNKPLSRDVGKPSSREKGEPLSREKGEPLSRGRDEPLSRDRGGRKPRNKNETISGPPLDEDSEMFYYDGIQTSECLDDRHRRRERIHSEEHGPVAHSSRKLIHHESTEPCHDEGGLMSSNKILCRKMNRSRSPISSKFKDHIQSNDHYKVNEKEIKGVYQHEKKRADDNIESSRTISPKYRSSSPKDSKSSDSLVRPHRPHISSSNVKGSHANQNPDERKVVSGSNNIDIPPIRNRLDRSDHDVKDRKRSNKEVEARSNGGKGDGHQTRYSKSDRKSDMDGKRDSKVKHSSHEDKSSLYKSKYEAQREKDRSEKSSQYNHKQKPNHDDRPRSRSKTSRERKHRSKESSVAKKINVGAMDPGHKNCSNYENKVSRSQNNSPSERLSASLSSKNNSNEKPLIVINKTDNDFNSKGEDAVNFVKNNPNTNSSELADDVQKFIPVSKSNWTEITTSNDLDGDTKSLEKVSSELSTRDTPSLSPTPSKDINLEEKLESSLVNQNATKPTESDHEVDQIDDGKSLKDDCLNVLDQIMDCSGELKASRDFFEDFDDQPEIQHDINTSGNIIEKTDGKRKSNDRSRKENESNLSKGRASKDNKQEKKEFNYKSTTRKYNDDDKEETYRRKKYDDSYLNHKLHDSNASERKSSRSNQVTSKHEDNLPKRKERNEDFDDKHSDRSKGSLERKRKRHESRSNPKHKEDKEGKIKERIAKKRKRSTEPDSTQKKKKKKSKHKDESGDKEIKVKTSKKKKKEKKSKKSKKSKKHRSESKEVVASVNQEEKRLRSKSPNDDLRQTLVRKPILKVVESPPCKNKTYLEDETSPVRISRKEEYLAYKRHRDNRTVAGIGHEDGRFSSKRDSKEESNSGSRGREARSRSSNGHHSRVRDAEMYSLPKRRMGTIQRTVYQGDGQEWSSKTDSRRRHQGNVTNVPPPLMKQNVEPLLPDSTDEFVDKLPVHMRLGPSANAGPHPPKKANINKGKRKGGRGRKSGNLPKRRN